MYCAWFRTLLADARNSTLNCSVIAEALQSREVEVVRRIELQCVAADVGKRAEARLDVLRVRVVGQVATRRPPGWRDASDRYPGKGRQRSSVAQRVDTGARALGAGCIGDHAIAGGSLRSGSSRCRSAAVTHWPD